MNDAATVFTDWAKRGRANGMEAGHGQTAGPLLASLQVAPGTRMLDVGCGNGWAARAAAARGASAVGIDVSAGMLAEAAKKGTAVARADAAAMPFPDAVFDLAWSMEALYYAPDVPAVLRELKRVLAPGATLHILVDYYGENTASHSWPTDLGLHMTLMSEAAWVNALLDAGFAAATADRLRADGTDADAWKATEGTLHLAANA